MKTWRTVGLVVVGMIIGEGAVDAQTLLRFKFKEGDKFHYVQEVKMPAGKDVTIYLNNSSNWQVIKSEESGAAQVKMFTSGTKMTYETPMGKAAASSLGNFLADVGGTEVTFTMDPTGEIKEIKYPETINKPLNKQTWDVNKTPVDSMLCRGPLDGGCTLPREAITPGKSWIKKTEKNVPMGVEKEEIKYTYEGPITKDGKNLEKIRLEIHVTRPQQSIKQDGKGYMYFDNEAGRIVEEEIEQTLTAQYGLSSQKMEATATMKLAK